MPNETRVKTHKSRNPLVREDFLSLTFLDGVEMCESYQ